MKGNLMKTLDKTYKTIDGDIFENKEEAEEHELDYCFISILY